MKKRVLFIAYLFPPVGGAGVQRTAKFVKYLPQWGWEPTVLTVANPSVPLFDAALLADIPPGTPVRRARTWEPSYALKTSVSAAGGTGGRRGRARRLAKGVIRGLGNLLLQPDPQALWIPAAKREGYRLLREVPHHAIVATAPPYSSFLVGAALSRRIGLPLVLDYRDEWTLSNAYSENKAGGRVVRFVQSRMQARVVRAATALVATTRASARALEGVQAAARAAASVTCIHNGYDPDDLPAAPAAARAADGTYRLVYIGTLWNLTSVEPLVAAVEHLAAARPDLAGRLELVFAGRRTADQDSLLGRLRGVPCKLVQMPYLDHRAAVELAASADGLCLLMSDVAGAERVLPAKVFEYVATRRPILAIAPRGEVWDILRDYPRAHLLEPGQVGAISRCLVDEIERSTKAVPVDWSGWDGERYDRANQARQLADLLSAAHAARTPA